MRILGIDPGSLKTGFAIVDSSARERVLIASGTILLDQKKHLGKRLADLEEDLDKIFQRYRPQQVAIESLFFAKNAQSAIKLSHARGVIIMKAAQMGTEAFEYSPAEVKMSLAGSGRATKEQIAKMLSLLLKLPRHFDFGSADESDAVALCLTHAQCFPVKWAGSKRNDRTDFWKTSH